MAHPDTPTTFYFIRHGNKPDDKTLHGLSPEGVERAEHIAKIFIGDTKGANTFPRPTHIFTAKPTKKGGQLRMMATVFPLIMEIWKKGDDVKLSILPRGDEEFKKEIKDDQTRAQFSKLPFIKDLKNLAEKKKGHNVLVCWEHGILYNIMKEIVPENLQKTGGSFPEKWADTDFDSVYVYTVGKDFVHKQEGFKKQ
jgi:hypothetical protein